MEPSMHRTRTRTAHATPPAVVFEGVGHDYGRTVALDGFDLTVRPGEVVAVLGPNGAGKTTAMHALMGLLEPKRGTVRLMGRDPRDRGAREQLGAMLQISGVPETLTVREHLRCFAATYPSPLPLDELMEMVGLTEVARRPYGKLSGGQKQRLHLAIALVGDPRVLVLDEPTTGLDDEHARLVTRALRDVSRGRTTFVITHDLSLALDADVVLVVEQGRIVEAGAPADLLADRGRFDVLHAVRGSRAHVAGTEVADALAG
jgi:ABC-2 type transport system ATP-binding protein